ncbi:MAG: hypothetical protein JSV65_06670 [Armatimonadota bacterium]|nr:MAG: hypothetical protein JSV65_06670 [Armatimonadota bacterium]
MSLSVDDRALMGMAVESVGVDAGGFEVLSPGARVTLTKAGELAVHQRIGAQRELLHCTLPPHLAPWRLETRTPFRCVLVSDGLRLTVQGDSVLRFAPQQPLRLGFRGGFRPHYAQEAKGNWLILDDRGGCGFYGIPARPTEAEGMDGAAWELRSHVMRWDELWVAICPPRPRDEARYAQSIEHDAPPFGDDVVREAAKHCQVFVTHAQWAADAPEWCENPPGSDYKHPIPWASARHVPADPGTFARQRDLAQGLGMKFVPYLSPYYSNAPDLLGEMNRVLDEYHVDGLYFDGWVGHRDDFRAAYEMIRGARALLGDRILYLHSSSEPYGKPEVYCPFVYAYTDFILSGEAGRGALNEGDFLRYVVSQYQISNAVGVWCYYGSMGLDGYHDVPPTTEHIKAALRHHARIWRQTQVLWTHKIGWFRYPEEFARFDREYYTCLAQEREKAQDA